MTKDNEDILYFFFGFLHVSLQHLGTQIIIQWGDKTGEQNTSPLALCQMQRLRQIATQEASVEAGGEAHYLCKVVLASPFVRRKSKIWADFVDGSLERAQVLDSKIFFPQVVSN